MSRIVMGGKALTPRPDPMPYIDPDAPEAPVLPFTAAGLAKGIKLAGAHVRWNTTRHAVMVRLSGETERYGDDETLDELFNAVSIVARGQRGRLVGAYWIPGARQESRLLGVVARWDSFAGDGDLVWQHVKSWCGQQSVGFDRRLSLTIIMRESDALRGYETGARADKIATRSATECLEACGWRWVNARPVDKHGCVITGANARKLWCSPIVS